VRHYNIIYSTVAYRIAKENAIYCVLKQVFYETTYIIA